MYWDWENSQKTLIFCDVLIFKVQHKNNINNNHNNNNDAEATATIIRARQHDPERFIQLGCFSSRKKAGIIFKYRRTKPLYEIILIYRMTEEAMTFLKNG